MKRIRTERGGGKRSVWVGVARRGALLSRIQHLQKRLPGLQQGVIPRRGSASSAESRLRLPTGRATSATVCLVHLTQAPIPMDCQHNTLRTTTPITTSPSSSSS
ncbi:unnamed protein product [Chrysoparadoxa australica]